MNTFTIHTDLACESEVLHDSGKSGTHFSEEKKKGFTVARLTVENEDGEKTSGKKMGEYVTVFSDMLCDIDSGRFALLTEVVFEELSQMIEKTLGRIPTCVLVAGLGNREITADNIGPKTVDRLTVTRHLLIHDKDLFDSFWHAPLCAIAPGVLGQTGIETSKILSGICGVASPDVIIAIDALAARSTERLGTTVQISNSGIFPGSGIGNRRGEISRETLSIPVIAVGIPTVVNSATLVYDALEKAGFDSFDEKIVSVLKSGESFFVSPKQSDRISESAAELLSGAIDRLFLK
ncbi:MAG: GPR endopeptidase [Clostridia bacterium]|nr:GPR endopeptidase [Clostridia bacterium]